MTTPLTTLTLDDLRQRRSVKWRRYDPDVLPLWVMEMDATLAPPITEALAAAVARGDTGYAHPARLPEAFAGFAQRHYGWSPDPARMTVVGDVLTGIRAALELVSAPGDGVVLHTPAYPPMFAHIAQAGRRVVESPLRRDAAGAYGLDLERLESDLARPEVTVLALCSPHNPTGVVFGRDELRAVVDLADAHGVRVVSDEIHAPMTYAEAVHVPVASLPGPGADAAITLVSASKAFNLPGLKAALIVGAGDRAAQTLAALPPAVGFTTGILGVLAAEVAFTQGDPWLAAVMADLDANRAILAGLLAEHLPRVRYIPPAATYVAWLDCTALGLGDDPAAALLDRARVALSAGPDFGPPGRGFARLNFATSPRILTEAVARIAGALAGTEAR